MIKDFNPISKEACLCHTGEGRKEHEQTLRGCDSL